MMKTDVVSDFRGKRVLVMGLGLHGGGVGTVDFLSRQGAEITVTDLRTARELAPSLRALHRIKGIRYVLGEHRMKDFSVADMIIKNPGVRRDSPYLQGATRRGIPIRSDMDIFFDLCPARIIGVTGTRGKSTTTYLIWQFLKTKYRHVHYAGNIRKSVLTLLPQVKKNDVVVLELSSFQLADLSREQKSPHIAIFTNLMRDHLNWHRTMHEYQEAKCAIFRFQRPDDYLFVPRDDATLRRMTRNAPSHIEKTTLAPALIAIVDQNLGHHYRSSVGLAAGVAQHFGVSNANIKKILSAFKGLEARQEEIARIRGVRMINDTTATTPDAAIVAIQRFRASTGSGHMLILIAGGSDKKLDFKNMARAIKKSVDRLVFLPGAGTEKLKRELPGIKYAEARSMREAVEISWRDAKRGDCIVLSPGAASFGLFLNEFDRGAEFARAVKKLK